MSEMTLEVHPRETRGSRASRRMRRGGRIPAVVYGGGKDTVPIEIDRKSLLDLLKQTGGENAVFLLKLAGSGKERHTMIREIDIDPVNREVRHLDFQRVLMTEKVRVQVPIEISGVPQGVKNEGGVLDFVHREVEVECLPGDIPRHLTLDVSALHIGQHLEASAIELPDSVTLIDEPSRVLVSIAQPRLAVEAEAEEGAEELLEAEREEPEVIRRGRAEDEDEEDEG